MAVELIFRPIEEGASALLWTGRDPEDLDVDGDGSIRPLREVIRHGLRRRFGMVLLEYSLATDLVWDTPDLREIGFRDRVRQALEAHRLTGNTGAPSHLFQALWGFLRTPSPDRWPDGKPLRYGLLVHFADHLVPHTNAGRTEDQTRAVEWVCKLATSLAMRSAGNVLILYTPDGGRLDHRLRELLREVRMPQPDREGKGRFLEAARQVYSQARPEEGIDWDVAAYLTTNTPNRVLEEILRAAHRTGEPVRAEHLIARRARAIEALSEGMLTPMDAGAPELFGRTVEHAWRLLERIAEGLRRGDPRTPHNVLLVGPPGSGKTELARRLAREARVNAFRVHSPKAGLVGETERRARLMFELLGEWAPNVAFCDEVTEILTTERSEHDLDAGASRAVLGAMLAYLGDESRRGRTVFLGATNSPWRMADALRSRFITVPVLMPLREDYPGIVATLARQVGGGAVNPADARVREAAAVFHAKGATPRHVRSALSNAHLFYGRLGPDEVLRAAQSFCGDTGRLSSIYSELWALHMTTSLEFCPWFGDPDYPLPDHLRGVVDPATGLIDHDELNRRIGELKPHAHV